MSIQYLYTEGEKPCEKRPLKVRLDGVVSGEIRKVAGGYQYFPKGQKEGGDVFGCLSLAQQSLS